VYEETLTGRPHDTSVQKATTDNENVDAVQCHAQDEPNLENNRWIDRCFTARQHKTRSIFLFCQEGGPTLRWLRLANEEQYARNSYMANNEHNDQQ